MLFQAPSSENAPLRSVNAKWQITESPLLAKIKLSLIFKFRFQRSSLIFLFQAFSYENAPVRSVNAFKMQTSDANIHSNKSTQKEAKNSVRKAPADTELVKRPLNKKQ